MPKSHTHTQIPWVPWKRYALVLDVDHRQRIVFRFRLRCSADRVCEDLNRYKGYKAVVVDTKDA